MEGWNNFGPTPLPLTVFAPYNFNFWSKDQRYKKEGLDANKGSTQLYVEISNKRSKVDFKVENIYFYYQYFWGHGLPSSQSYIQW